jgi:predicted peptidase
VQNAKKFAAIVPVCGVCYYDYKSLVNISKAGTPVWAFVGESDKVVNPACTLQAVSAVNEGTDKKLAKLTVYKKAGHNVWDLAFDTTNKFQNPNVYEWMLQHSRKTMK